MPEVMLLATSSPRVYSLPTTERAADAVIGRIIPGAVRLVTRVPNRAVFLCRDGGAGDVLARLGVMESRSCQRPAALAVAAIIGLLILPLPSNGEVSCHPNIFGGKDHRLPSGERIESRPNIFGGQDFRQPSGHVVECHPNIFGGEDCR